MPTFSGRIIPVQAIISVFNSFEHSGSSLCSCTGLGSALEADPSFQAPPGKHTREVGAVEAVPKKRILSCFHFLFPFPPCFEMIPKCFPNCF